MRISTPILKQMRKKPPVVIPIGIGLNDEREECFALLIADGVPLAIAFKTAGFKASEKSISALALFRAKRLQDRVTAILRARASHPPVSLSEVTDMLKRVYTGAIHSNEYTPAHNAAFSLARLYGLVVDRAQLDVVRRPSREPDAPSEIALSDWIQRLPGPDNTTQVVSSANTTQVVSSPRTTEPSGLVIEGSAHGNDLDGGSPGQIGNGAPSRPVTGTPHVGGHSDVLAPHVGGHSDVLAPHVGGGGHSDVLGPELDEGTGIQGAEPPISAEDLF